jgi:DsbC/DsbD-like thiol-disulfide interchange protein
MATAALASIGLVVGLGSAASQVASPWNAHPNAKVRLIAGEGRMLGIEVVLAPGWKTYWRMPGDAGVPPAFDWAGSVNVGVFDVLYPAPVSMPDQGGTAVGYKGTVVFPVRVTLADETKPSKVVLEFAFGVCKDICIPIESKLALDLPGSVQPWPSAPPIKAHLARVPQIAVEPAKSKPAVLAVTHGLDGVAPHITVQTRGAGDVYVEAPDGLFVPLAQKTAAADGTVRFVIDLTKSPDRLGLAGKVLRITVVGPEGAVETSVAVK